jgi:hypothetical protein
MARSLRIEYTNAVNHVTPWDNDRWDIFKKPLDRDRQPVTLSAGHTKRKDLNLLPRQYLNISLLLPLSSK